MVFIVTAVWLQVNVDEVQVCVAVRVTGVVPHHSKGTSLDSNS